MSAVKSGKHIYVEGTGNTLASIASDISDPAFCSWNAGTKTMTVFGTSSNVRYLRFRSGSHTILSEGETLQFSNATNDDTRMYVDAGSHLELRDDCTINGSLTTTRPYYWYFYGRVTCVPNLALNLRPTLLNFYRMFCYETANNNNFPNDIWDFTGARIGGSRVNNGIAFYIYPMGKVRQHIFRDMIFDESIGSNLDTYGFHFPYGITGWDKIILENIEFERTERAMQASGGAVIHSKGCTINNTSNSWGVLHYGNANPSARKRLRAYDYHNTVPYGQVFSYHEELTVKAGNNANKINITFGAEVLFRACDFQRTSGDSVECKYQGRFMEWGLSNTYADSAPYDVAINGERAVVYHWQPTILDENGDPIENALVKIEQHALRETFTFTTGADGRLHAIHDLKGAMLTHESYYTNTVKETWSQPVAPHRYQVFVEGYEVASGTMVMDQDRAVTINMVPTGVLLEDFIEDFSQAPGIAL